MARFLLTDIWSPWRQSHYQVATNATSSVITMPTAMFPCSTNYTGLPWIYKQMLTQRHIHWLKPDWVHYPFLYTLHIIMILALILALETIPILYSGPSPALHDPRFFIFLYQLHLWDPASLILDLYTMQNTSRISWKHINLITFNKWYL